MNISGHTTIFLALLVLFQILFLYLNASHVVRLTPSSSWKQQLDNSLQSKDNNAAVNKYSHINSFWWPSPSSSGGFLSAIHRAQHSSDCSSPSTKYLVLRSLKNNDGDNRGLSAWASVTMHHFLHAFSDGDDASSSGRRRILVADEELWPMARGCKHGTSEMRECYFVPFSNCNLSHVDSINDSEHSVALKDAKQEYDRGIRTVYTSNTAKYARMTKDTYGWTGLQGKDYPKISLVAAFLAYYLQPQPWLRQEIDARLHRSLPPDLDPDRTIGVPIRRSDKCHGHSIEGSAKGELDCPSLNSYLKEVQRFMEFDPNINSVIITSEDSSAASEFVSLVQQHLPQLRIVTNKDDVQQGTGSASKLESYKTNVENEKVVASALTSLHMHLRARYFVITTKSSWTSTIAILARVYGFAADVIVVDIGPTTHAFSYLAKFGGNGQ
ncbi:hypothetical protein ACHAWO_012656 [Cyclotella atomus]|uniref:Fucosyltransferase n=1 Tax=Cyclotella atomus TaxID=382360 RepID=A0ABD3PMW8_9STRA